MRPESISKNQKMNKNNSKLAGSWWNKKKEKKSNLFYKMFNKLIIINWW